MQYFSQSQTNLSPRDFSQSHNPRDFSQSHSPRDFSQSPCDFRLQTGILKTNRPS